MPKKPMSGVRSLSNWSRYARRTTVVNPVARRKRYNIKTIYKIVVDTALKVSKANRQVSAKNYSALARALNRQIWAK